MRYWINSIFILLLSFSSFASEAKEIKEGMSFIEARKILISQGWKPFFFRDLKGHVSDEDYESYTQITLAKDYGYKEAIACTGSGIAYCIFMYKKEEKCLLVYTENEEVEDMVIRFWKHECPDPKYLYSK